MLELSNLGGLFALAALALPLAIHLWRPPPRTVRLGSLRFLDNLPHQRMRNLQWREYLLLAVRLALLAALAVLLAGPLWRRKPPTGPQRWALVDPFARLSGESLDRLNALQKSGYIVHRLVPGLPIDEPSAASAPPPDLWARLREADAALPAGSTLAVLTPGRIASLHGTRPALRHCRVEWIPTPDAAGTAPRSWLESPRVYSLPGKPPDVRAVVGTSDAWSTRFAPGGPSGPAVETSADGLRLRLAGTEHGPWIAAASRSSPLRVSILHDADRAEDARYVAAAVAAVGTASGQPTSVSLQELEDTSRGPRMEVDWVFWLSERPVPGSFEAGVPNLLRDSAASPGEAPGTTDDHVVALPGSPGEASLDEEAVHLWRLGRALPGQDQTLWTTGHGEPLLTLHRATHQRLWTFASRFHLGWNDLPRSAALASVVRDLLQPQPSSLPVDPAHDLRLADPSQYHLSFSPASDRNPAWTPVVPDRSTDLHWPWWLVAVALFVLERTLSFRPNHGSPVAPPTPAFAVR